jgi:hypothetical protein
MKAINLKAEEIKKFLKNNFVEEIIIRNSETNYGESTYISFYKNDIYYKIRISDHESTNDFRVKTEIMFNQNDNVEKIKNSLEQIIFPERFDFRQPKNDEKPTHFKNGKFCVIFKIK